MIFAGNNAFIIMKSMPHEFRAGMMDTGLTQADIERITAAIKQFPEIEEAVIFGSRAKETYKKASDVDLAIIRSRRHQRND